MKLIYIKKKTLIDYSEEKQVKKLFKTSFIISFIGVSFKIIDRFIIREISFNQPSMINREIAELSSGNIFAIIGSMFFLTSFITMFLLIYQKKNKIRVNVFIEAICIIMFLYFSIDGYIMGSRFPFIITAFIFVSYILIFNKISYKTIIIILLIIFLLATLISFIWFDRLEQMNLDRYAVLYDRQYSNMIPVSDNYLQLLYDTEGKLISNYLYFFIHLSQYYLHGLFELDLLIDYIDSNNISPAFGGNTFFIIDKFFAKIFNYEIINISEYYPHPGIYTTFLGPIFVDFQYFGFIFMFFFGIFQYYIWKKIINNNDLIFIPLYIYIVLINISMPVINLLVGNGTYLLFSYIFFILVFNATKKISLI